MIGRRAMVAGGLAAVAAPALGQTRPRPRPDPAERKDAAAMACAAAIAAANLGGRVGYAVADLATGRVLAGLNAQAPMPPASVSKAVTALFALERLGAERRFSTQL